jgi:hypothetical protein
MVDRYLIHSFMIKVVSAFFLVLAIVTLAYSTLRLA